MTGRVLTGYRHDLQVTARPRTSWWIFAACLALVIFARSAGI